LLVISYFNLAIAGREFLQGEWLDIINVLVHTSDNEDKNIKLASIITLGNIAQEVQPADITEENISKALSAFYQIFQKQQDDDVLEVTTESLYHYISFIKKNIENSVNTYLILGTKRAYFKSLI
jgi:hypothetical protein